MKPIYHYTESGLDNVFLVNGFDYIEAPGGNRTVYIQDIDGLHEAIGLALIRRRQSLSGKELRFLRNELLLSQVRMSQMLGVTEQTVARWEKGETTMPRAGEALVRVMFAESMKQDTPIRDVLERIADLDDEEDGTLNLEETPDGWAPARVLQAAARRFGDRQADRLVSHHRQGSDDVMTKADCPVCRGAGTIRLPLYRGIAVVEPTDTGLAEANRTYPCPECADTIPHERLHIIRYTTRADARLATTPYYITAIQSNMARGIAHRLLEAGLIQLSRGPDDDRTLQFEAMATLGVAAPTEVQSLEARIAEHQDQLANAVIHEASVQIATWRSAYQGEGGAIEKSMAIRMLHNALGQVVARQSEWRDLNAMS